MAKGIKKLIDIARANVSEQIRSSAGYNDNLSERSSFFARGVSGEGFNGGYRAALDDVLLALNGSIPDRNGWWRNPPNKAINPTPEPGPLEQSSKSK